MDDHSIEVYFSDSDDDDIESSPESYTNQPQPQRPVRRREDIPFERRWGLIPLSLRDTYGKRSGWGCRAGIRELVQNLYSYKINCLI